MAESIVLERHYRAAVEEVWALWTTKDGIESWWGPEGFSVTVHRLDLRVGGELHYTMTATAPEQVTFMQQAGMPLATDSSFVYTEVALLRSLSYRMRADFIPDIEPYESTTTVTFHPEPDGVHMVLTLSPMHNEEWTQRAVLGHESQLEKLETTLNDRTSRRHTQEIAQRKPNPVVVAAIVAGHLIVTSLAWRDLRFRPDEQIRGSKKGWKLATGANTVNSLAYFLFGRRRH